MRNSMMN